MAYAVLTVTFYDGERLCGVSARTLDVLPPDRPVTFDVSSIFLSGDIAGDILRNHPCELPMRTTRMEVELWTHSASWSNSLKVGLPGTYTFVHQ